VEKGGRIVVSDDAPIFARVTATNLGEARWLSPADHEGPGRVWLVLRYSDDSQEVRIPLPKSLTRFGQVVFDNVPLHARGPLFREKTVTLRLCAEDRAWFGPVFTLRLLPR